MKITQIAEYLNGLTDTSKTGMNFDCTIISGEIDVLQVTVFDREELPIFISVTADQILCVIYLWGIEEIKSDRINELNDAMLRLNLPMPLSSFAKIADKDIIFGALSIHSSNDDIEHELATLSDNSIHIINDMCEFLK